MAKHIKFTASGSCSALGNFAPGDIARNIPDALADHLVHEAMCAQYHTTLSAPPLPAPPAPVPTATPPKPRKSRAQATQPTQPGQGQGSEA